MPIFERFMPGTRWQLTVGQGSLPSGAVVTVQEAPYEEINEMYVKVATEDGTCEIVPLSNLA